MGEVQVGTRPQLHPAPLPAHSGRRKQEEEHWSISLSYPGTPAIYPHQAYLYLSGSLLLPRLCLETRQPTQPSSFCAQVSISSSEKTQPLARQMWLEKVMRQR